MNQDQINDMYKQPTAVDWLFNQIPLEWTMKKAAYDAYKQAKSIEKEQMLQFGSKVTDRWGLTKVEEHYIEHEYNKYYLP